MIAAVMQPYLFPYIGYYQLVKSSDEFVIYDDVNYIKGGYINRNNILVSGCSQRFTLPIVGASPNKKISELYFDTGAKKILKTIEQSYRKAPHFDTVFDIVNHVLLDDDRRVVNIAGKSISIIFDYLNIEKSIRVSSDIPIDKSLGAQDRLIEMSKFLKCDKYVNSPGGKRLYDETYFRDNGVKLMFINCLSSEYNQKTNNFVPYLSMLDILMWCSKDEVIKLLNEYELT